MERVDKILKAENPIKERPDARHISEMKEGLEFRHISFSYGTHEVLHDVSLSIKKGETIALVGQSGSGKSKPLP